MRTISGPLQPTCVCVCAIAFAYMYTYAAGSRASGPDSGSTWLQRADSASDCRHGPIPVARVRSRIISWSDHRSHAHPGSCKHACGGKRRGKKGTRERGQPVRAVTPIVRFSALCQRISFLSRDRFVFELPFRLLAGRALSADLISFVERGRSGHLLPCRAPST